jgi:glycosyltransferase involved in cell wall biosynthesis
MKIVHIIPFFLPEKIAGSEIYCWSLCKFLQSKGVTCEILTPNYGSENTVEYVYDDIRVVKYAEPTRATRFLQMGLALPEGINAFRNHLINSKPNCVHFHGLYGSVGITVEHISVAKSLGISTLYTMHLAGNVCITNTLVHKQKELCDGIIRPRRCSACLLVHLNKRDWLAEFFASVSNLLYQSGIDTARLNNPLGTGFSLANRIGDLRKNLEKIALHCDRVVVPAKWFRDILIANHFPKEKIDYLEQALPLFKDPPTNLPPLKFNNKRSVKVVFAGRISSFKGLDILLQAIRTFPEDKVELSIYGQNDGDEFYQKCLELSKDKPNIHWRGVLPHEEVLAAFHQHDALCLPSTFSEMAPLVIQEAFAAGIPVIASEVYGNLEMIVPEENGLLFAFRSVEDLRLKLARIVDNTFLLSSMKNRVKPPIPFEKLGQDYIDLYEKISSGLKKIKFE